MTPSAIVRKLSQLRWLVQRLLAWVLYLVAIIGGVPSFANVAALAVYPDAALDSGALAYVKTVRGYYSLDRASAATLDGINVIATANGTGRWLRTGYADPFWLGQTVWFIDPQNVSGTASDENPGTSNLLPLRTWNKGVAARYGTLTPQLTQSTTWSFMSSHTDLTDPVLFAPFMLQGAVPTLQGVATAPVASGILGGVVARNKATATLLQANVGAVGTAVGVQVVNTTAGKSSKAWLYKNVAGNVWSLTQPLTPAAPPISFTPIPTEVNTWANGDTFDLHVPVAVNVGYLNPQLIDVNGGFTNNFQLYQLTTFQSGFGSTIFGANITTSECNMQRLVDIGGAASELASCFINCFNVQISGTASQAVFQNNPFPLLRVYGGTVKGTNFAGLLDLDVILGGALFTFLGGQIGSIFLDAITMQINALTDFQSATIATIWGSGNIDVAGTARLAYKAGAGAAAAQFLLTGTIQLNTLTTGYSLNSGAGAAWNGGIAITPTTLDTAQDAANFGGRAINPGGASIVNGGV